MTTRRRWSLGAILLTGVMGCVTTGKAPDVPLVSVPPPPLGLPEVPPATPPSTARALPRATLQSLHRAALDKISTAESYIVRLTRREVVNGHENPQEMMLFRFRNRPWSVYLKWLGKEGQGREVLYVKGKHGDKIHTLLAAGDFPFMPAGKRMALSPDSMLVKSACRHPITEAGIGASIDRIGRLIAAVERGEAKSGKLAVLGPMARDEFDKAVFAMEHTFPPGFDRSLPKGGKRTYYFHPETHLPMLVIAHDETGREVEYYRYDRLQLSVKLDDADFEPDTLWGKPVDAAKAAR